VSPLISDNKNDSIIVEMAIERLKKINNRVNEINEELEKLDELEISEKQNAKLAELNAKEKNVEVRTKKKGNNN